MELTFDQMRAYFEHHHPGQKIAPREKVSVRCCFHEDHTPSCTLFLSGNGAFHCNGCGAKGNIFQFESRVTGCSVAEAEQRVAAITGAQPRPGYGSAKDLGPAIAFYDYRDENGRTLFQKRRYQPFDQPKTFRIYRPGLGLVLFPARVAAASLGIMGVLAAVLAITGTFGVAAYAVSKRLREFGVRVALGADRSQLLRSALARPLVLLAAGSVIGLVLGILVSRVLSQIVYQATPRDPWVLGGAVATMVLIGLAATCVPARRALAVDPARLLREE